MDAGASFTKKVGGLPMWVWVIGVGSLAAVFVVYRRNKAAAAATTYVPATGDASQTGGIIGSWTLPSVSSPNAMVYTTNAAWGVAAITWLIAQGYPVNTSQSAVSRYLSSKPLTAEETALRDVVLKALGPPPDLPLPQDTRDPNPPLVDPPVVSNLPPEYISGPQTTGIYEYDPNLNTRYWLSPGQWAGIRAADPSVQVQQLDPNAHEWDWSTLIGTNGEAPRTKGW